MKLRVRGLRQQAGLPYRPVRASGEIRRCNNAHLVTSSAKPSLRRHTCVNVMVRLRDLVKKGAEPSARSSKRSGGVEFAASG
jgi:hypothetical protein